MGRWVFWVVLAASLWLNWVQRGREVGWDHLQFRSDAVLTQEMKVIDSDLKNFHKENGRLPNRLSELYPTWCCDPSVFFHFHFVPNYANTQSRMRAAIDQEGVCAYYPDAADGAILCERVPPRWRKTRLALFKDGRIERVPYVTSPDAIWLGKP